MKYIIIFFVLLFNVIEGHAQVYPTILNNTKYCQAGSQAHPASYCVDATPCKQISGFTVCLNGTPTVQVSTPAVLSGYSCPTGYILNGASCEKTISISATVSYLCPAGATLSGSSCITTTSTPATVNYSCPPGATQSGGSCYTSTSFPATVNYQCPSGYSLSGTQCTKTTTSTTSPTVSYSCAAGWTLSGTNCTSVTATTPSSTCPSGSTYSGGVCVVNPYVPTSTYSCPAGQTLYSNPYVPAGAFGEGSTELPLVPGAPVGRFFTPTCVVNAYTYLAPTYLPNGVYPRLELSLVQCIDPGNWFYDAAICSVYPNPPPYIYKAYAGDVSFTPAGFVAVGALSCPKGGAIQNSLCTGAPNLTPGISCPSGSVLSGGMCYTTNSTAASAASSCPSGYSLIGGMCSSTSTSSIAATVSYSCPSGATLSGTSCNTTGSSGATASYSCPSGSSLSGTNCISTSAAPATVEYSCPATYLLNGTSCDNTSYVAATPVYTCSTGVLSGTNCLSGQLPNGALQTTFSCWSTATDYSCYQEISECSLYTANPACAEVGSRTCLPDSTGAILPSISPKLGPCMAYTRTFNCLPTGAATTTTTTTCDPVDMLNGLDWSTSSPSSANDFVAAATNQEFARQLVTYGYDGTDTLGNLFHGAAMSCADGWIGLKNCCSGGGGGVVSNFEGASLMGNVAGTALKVGATYGAKWGAPYVYDLMMSNAAPDILQGGVASMANGLQSYGSNPLNGIGMYGFGFTDVGAAGTFASSTSSIALGQTGLYFNPYALAASLAIQIVMDALSCSEIEKDLVNLKSQNLCHYVGSYCSRKLKFLGATIACLETTESYCCFNGLLAKGILEGAHNQLGISWGSPESPNCAGLSVAQLQSLDLSGPAFAGVMEPFKAKVLSNFQNNAGSRMSNGSIQNDLKTTGTSNIRDMCLQRQLLEPTIVCP